MAYGDSGEILNSLTFYLTSATYSWGAFLAGDGILPSGAYPVNQGVDQDSHWDFSPTPANCTYWLDQVTASSTHGLPNAGIENHIGGTGINFPLSMINAEIYVKAQLFIVNTVTNTAGATLDIPVAGLNTVGGATINVPSPIWQPLQATGQQHKIVLRAYVAHFKYRKGCWSGGNHAARVNETTINAAAPTGPGTYDWDKGWINNIDSPAIATWSGSQVLRADGGSAPLNKYYSGSISIQASLEAILPDHPVNGAGTNVIDDPYFQLGDLLKVNVNWATVNVAGGDVHSLGLRSDGRVEAVGWNDYSQLNVGSWTNIIAVAGGYAHSLGLRSDGKVVAVGFNDYSQCNVDGWTGIIAIAAGTYHSLGLRSNGTVVAVGFNDYGQRNVGSWTNIIAVSGGFAHSLGLRSNGTVVAVGWNGYGQCNVESWTNIIAIAARDYYSLGLKSDGKVVAVGFNDYGQCNVDGWTNIVAITAGVYHSLGLTSGGTVVAVGFNDYGQCNVDGWTNIVAISAGYGHSLGLKSDGTVVAVGWNGYGQRNVGGWDLIP